MGCLSHHEISSERKGSSSILLVWWVFLSAVSQKVLTSLKLTNGTFKINNLGSPWIYIGVPMCVLGHSMIFLLVLQKCTDLGYVSKEKTIWNSEGEAAAAFLCRLCVHVCWLPSLQQPLLDKQGWRHSTSHSYHLAKVVGECQLSIRNDWYFIEKHFCLQEPSCTGTS